MRLFCVLIILFVVAGIIPNMAQEQECNPIITGVRFDGERDLDISRRILQLYQADQAARQPNEEIDWEIMYREDLARREEVLAYLQAGQILLSEDLFRVALIFQHGNCPEHYALAADLALRAFELDYPSAGWLYAAATDRYLQSIGQFQIYGTQYTVGLDGHFTLCPVSGEISDEERAEYGLPGLDALKARAQEFDGSYIIEPNRFAFLTRIPVLGRFINAWVLRANCMRS
jgi:hypothetical protein